MLRKSKALILCLMLCIGLLVPFESRAFGENQTGTFTVKYTEPFCSEDSGYVSVMYKTTSGMYRMNTYFWHFTNPVSGSSYIADNKMTLTVNSSSINFHYSTQNSTNLVLAYYDWEDSLHIKYSGYLDGEMGSIIESLGSNEIVGYAFSGNCIVSGGLLHCPTPSIIWNRDTDGYVLNSQMVNVLTMLGNVDSNTSVIISKLENIYNQNVETNRKIDEMIILAQQIKDKQEESNTWLEKIFDLLKNAPEEEKNQAQTQGSQSTSDATTSITDNSQGFIDSLGGLANSMNYSGTSCSWTFPAITLPAIPGVMDSMQLTTEQPIDFTYWVNQIPANLLLLIQSLSTIALIIYCFKEVYGTISYVLTLRGGGNE